MYYFCYVAIINSNTEEAAEWLQKDVIAIPTETVYGLAANALDVNLVAKIFEVKKRPTFDPLIVHFADIKRAQEYVIDFPDVLMTLAKNFLPGPLTILLPKKDSIPDLVTSGLPRVGVRVPAHPLAAKLLQSLPFPLAAPSANPFGYISPTTALHVNQQLGEQIPFILDGGACKVGLESTIVGEEDGQLMVYRLGGISLEQIESLGLKPILRLNQSSNPTAPGMLLKHYAPRKKIVLTSHIQEEINKQNGKKVFTITLKNSKDENGVSNFPLSESGNLTEAAANLFAALRKADQSDADVIIAEIMPEIGLGKAMNDRLRRAAYE
jgi:L-threonylcarbamoyladenylate synthase